MTRQYFHTAGDEQIQRDVLKFMVSKRVLPLSLANTK